MAAEALSGRFILVTRPRRQSEPLTESLRRHGARVVEAPAIRIEAPSDHRPLDEAIEKVARGSYDWVVFTSANGVEAFFDRLEVARPGASLAGARFAAIGPATVESLLQRGHEAEVVPERFVAEEVFAALAAREDLSGKRLLLPRADIAREALPELLRGAGALVDAVAFYRTLPASDDIRRARELVEREGVDVVTFTSASTARSFFAEVEPSWFGGRVAAASIGPVTSRALRELGVEPRIEAARFTVEGLVEAIVRHFRES